MREREKVREYEKKVRESKRKRVSEKERQRVHLYQLLFQPRTRPQQIPQKDGHPEQSRRLGEKRGRVVDGAGFSVNVQSS